MSKKEMKYREGDGLTPDSFEFVKTQMLKIEAVYNREEIAIICDVSIRTVHNWFRYGTIELRKLYKLNCYIEMR